MANTFLERTRARLAKLATKQAGTSQLVVFRKTPGETVYVRTPAQPETSEPSKPPAAPAPPVPPPAVPPVTAAPAPQPSNIDVPGPNGGRKCSVCHKPGHTKANCPDAKPDDELSLDELEKLTAPDKP